MSCVDRRCLWRENRRVSGAGASRKQIARTLTTAYAGGLLSEDTFLRRLDQLWNARLIDPFRLIEDLTLRGSADGRYRRCARRMSAWVARLGHGEDSRIRSRLLALDWTGGQRELVLGRHRTCDVVLSDPTVSRRHARLIFRDGTWVLQDLQSTNGTTVNGMYVGRCELRPGDRLVLGNEHLRVD